MLPRCCNRSCVSKKILLLSVIYKFNIHKKISVGFLLLIPCYFSLIQNYEKELRETNSRNFGPDLEAVFGAMRVEEVTSDAETAKERDQSSSHGDESHSSDPCAAVLSVAGQRSASSSRKNGDSESMIKRTARIQQLLHKGAKKSTATANKKHVHSVRNKEDVINKNCKKASGRPHKSAKDRRVRKGSLSEDSKGDITNVTRVSHIHLLNYSFCLFLLSKQKAEGNNINNN